MKVKSTAEAGGDALAAHAINSVLEAEREAQAAVAACERAASNVARGRPPASPEYRSSAPRHAPSQLHGLAAKKLDLCEAALMEQRMKAAAEAVKAAVRSRSAWPCARPSRGAAHDRSGFVRCRLRVMSTMPWRECSLSTAVAPDRSAWRRLEASHDLGQYLEAARGSMFGPWVASLDRNRDAHAIERTLRGAWRSYVRRVAAWHPRRWQPWLSWLEWLPTLGLMRRLAQRRSRACLAAGGPHLGAGRAGSVRRADLRREGNCTGVFRARDRRAMCRSRSCGWHAGGSCSRRSMRSPSGCWRRSPKPCGNMRECSRWRALMRVALRNQLRERLRQAVSRCRRYSRWPRFATWR